MFLASLLMVLSASAQVDVSQYYLVNSGFDTDFDYKSGATNVVKEEIKEVYDALNEGMAVIGTAEIVNHTMLAQDVFLTEYANGSKVVTNYTFEDVDYNGTTVKANDYLILKGGN